MKRRQAPLNAAELLNAARTALTGLPVTFAHSFFGPASLHVQGTPGGPLAKIDVYAAPGDIAALGADLSRAVHALPVWDAWMAMRPRPPCDWVWGYLHARRHHLPRSGVYRPCSPGELMRDCQHPNAAVMRARTQGVRAYLEQMHERVNAAD